MPALAGPSAAGCGFAVSVVGRLDISFRSRSYTDDLAARRTRACGSRTCGPYPLKLRALPVSFDGGWPGTLGSSVSDSSVHWGLYANAA